MKTKYRTRFGEITALVIEKETEHFVVIQGRRSAKRADWENFFDTREEAVEHLVGAQKNAVQMARDRYEAEKAKLAKMCEKFNQPIPS